MEKHWISAWGITVCIAVGSATIPFATAQADSTSPAAPMVQHGPGGIDYISGGAGEEDRATMTAQQAAFPFKLVLSGTGGEYVVADTLSLSTAQGKAVVVRDAGPVVMLKLPAGDYNVEAVVQGKTERRAVHVQGGAQTVNWSFAG